MTKQRKTNLTNVRYNDEHRKLGRELYMYDVDGIEVDENCETVALIETKHYIEENIDHYQLKTLTKLADRANLPLFYVFYYYPGKDDVSGIVDRYGPDWQYKVFPINKLAKNILSEKSEMTKKQFTEFQYKLRNKKANPLHLSEFSDKYHFVPFIDSI